MAVGQICLMQRFEHAQNERFKAYEKNSQNKSNNSKNKSAICLLFEYKLSLKYGKQCNMIMFYIFIDMHCIYLFCISCWVSKIKLQILSSNNWQNSFIFIVLNFRILWNFQLAQQKQPCANKFPQKSMLWKFLWKNFPTCKRINCDIDGKFCEFSFNLYCGYSPCTQLSPRPLPRTRVRNPLSIESPIIKLVSITLHSILLRFRFGHSSMKSIYEMNFASHKVY